MSAAPEEPSRPFFYTRGAFWENKKTNNLWVLQLLTILPITGFFGIDHLFLRSPITALAKTFINFITLGLWYFYDILQVTTDKDTVKQFGFSVPIYGPTGIGAGQLLEPGEAPNKDAPSHWRFILYAILTLLPLGLDFFVAGDFAGGGLRFMTSVIFLLWPLGFFWGCYNMYRVWFTPDDLLKKGTYRIWPFSIFIDKYKSVAGVLGPGSPEQPVPVCREKGIVETIMEPVNTIIGVGTSIVAQPVSTALQGVAELPSRVGDAAVAAIAPVQAVMEVAAPTVSAGIQIAKTVPPAIAAVPAVAANVSNRLAEVAKPEALIASAGPAVSSAALVSKAAEGVLKGGSASGSGSIQLFSDSALLFTIGILVFGGAIISLIRSRPLDEPTKKNDAPPKPGDVRRTPPTK